MRTLAFLPLVLLTGACWTPAPGQLDPSLYPWDPVNRAAAAGAKGEYCIVSLESPAATGIAARGAVSPFEQVRPGARIELGCHIPANARPAASAAEPDEQLIHILCNTAARKPSCGRR